MNAYPFAGAFVLAPEEPAPITILNAAAASGWRADGPARVVSRPASRRSFAAAAVAGSALPLTRTYAFCGRPIAVSFDPPSLEALVAPRFGHARVEAEAVATMALTRTARGFAMASPGGVRHLRSETELVGAFVRRFVELSHATEGWRAVMHAAAVACEWGAIVLAGPSGSGKSTLVAGLLAAGCGYMSDDCAPVARSGELVPVPIALCVKSGSWAIAARLLPGLADAPTLVGSGGRRCRFVPPNGVAASALPPRLMIFPRFARGAETKFRALDPLETLVRLIEARTWLSRNPDDLAATFALLERLPSYALDYGDLDEAVAAVLALDAGLAS